jgi:hypothetical protein
MLAVLDLILLRGVELLNAIAPPDTLRMGTPEFVIGFAGISRTEFFLARGVE